MSASSLTDRPVMVAPVKSIELVTVRAPIVELTASEAGRVSVPVMVRSVMVVVARLVRPVAARLVEVALSLVRLEIFPVVAARGSAFTRLPST